MTIPSRPAPPPPKTNNNTRVTSRYTPTTSWDDTPFEYNNLTERDCAHTTQNKKQPPPRPPPPTIGIHQLHARKKTGQQTSINILSNLFGPSKRSKTPPNNVHGLFMSATINIPPKLPPCPVSNRVAIAELINFDSPPASPILTPKSKNSDSLSIGSFNSESNYSPFNGNISQSESGFEDDFTASNYLNTNSWDNSDPFSPKYDAITKSTPANFDDPLCNGKSLLPPEPVLSMPTIIKPVIKTPKPKLNNTNQLHIQQSISNTSLPMPSCPPPPPPRQHIVDNADVDEPFGIALFDFIGTQDGDLSLKQNDKIYLFKKLNDEWYYGKNKRGCQGMFPVSYINVIVPTKDEIHTHATSHIYKQQIPQTARAIYDFAAEKTEDLTLKANDMVTVLYAINDEWLFGKIGTRQGQFPINFIEYTEASSSKNA